MDRDRALPLALALLAIVSLGLAAATLDSAVAPGGSGSGGSDAGIGDDTPRTPTPEQNRSAAPIDSGAPATACWPFLTEPPALLALVGLFVALFALVARATDSKLAGGAVCIAAVVPVAIIWGTLATCPSPDPPDNESATATPGITDPNGSSVAEGGSGGGFGEVAADTLSSPSVLVALLFVLAVGIAVVAVLGARGDDMPDEEPDLEPVANDEDVAAVGRVAGTAADRIEADAATENEVYRAWREMTDELAVENPDATTPGEFADAAIAAGMDAEDVAELTDLFETVRYGGFDATEERERRAVETLRHIEETYGGAA
ncbi:DUF4129 domain-containing protein [Natronomonas halophila]|uniref:DUF4129 domain-containing protein n=1 Tax=Natronomonas halophila TaxID=2747817 RepID=UPI0015B4628E|nr:DUF4129 domain-containing protein [Natronomonas halophila]QLD86518.1 DUF4129 domain-containing protein [Natronomonas halophila]